MLLFPNCKINIGLRVVRKREDGYHDLETVFYPIKGLRDELEVERVNSQESRAQSNWSFVQEGLAVDCAAEDNLIMKCYRQMAERYPQIGPVRIRLRKNIPFGAGLGGGSSDAAHMAIALNELFALGLSREQLVQEVRSLGADCAFFIYNEPCFATGIGDILTPLPLSLSGKRIIMVKPDIHVSTREAYLGLALSADTAPHTPPCTIEEMLRLSNDFEQTVFALHPKLAEIKQHLIDAGAVYAAMSGSGSTVFGLFENDTESRAHAGRRLLDEQTASMVILDDTLA